MAVSYAGANLIAFTAEMAAIVESRISLEDVLEFQADLIWPGKNITNWTFPGHLPNRGVRVGSLYWPTGASHYALSHWIVDDQTLNQISQQVYSEGSYLAGAYQPQPLVISQCDPFGNVINSITASMFLISAHPLFQIPGMLGMWLLTLVDDRYWWWLRDTGSIQIVEDTTTWVNLFTDLGAALDVTITTDPIPSAYLYPSIGFTANYERSPIMLDAVAYNVGQRIVRQLNGTVLSRNPVNALSDQNTDLANPAAAQMRGGFKFRYTAGTANQDFPGILPYQVRVTFPQESGGVPESTLYVVDVTLASLNLADFTGVTTNAETQTFHDTAMYVGTNSAELLALAQQIATDWYRWQVQRIDAAWDGIIPWVPDAMDDYVEWHHGPDDVSTRVQRGPLNDMTEELLHASATYGSGPTIITTPTLYTSNTYYAGNVTYIGPITYSNTVNFNGPVTMNNTFNFYGPTFNIGKPTQVTNVAININGSSSYPTTLSVNANVALDVYAPTINLGISTQTYGIAFTIDGSTSYPTAVLFTNKTSLTTNCTPNFNLGIALTPINIATVVNFPAGFLVKGLSGSMYEYPTGATNNPMYVPEVPSVGLLREAVSSGLLAVWDLQDVSIFLIGKTGTYQGYQVAQAQTPSGSSIIPTLTPYSGATSGIFPDEEWDGVTGITLDFLTGALLTLNNGSGINWSITNPCLNLWVYFNSFGSHVGGGTSQPIFSVTTSAGAVDLAINFIWSSTTPQISATTGIYTVTAPLSALSAGVWYNVLAWWDGTNVNINLSPASGGTYSADVSGPPGAVSSFQNVSLGLLGFTLTSEITVAHASLWNLVPTTAQQEAFAQFPPQSYPFVGALATALGGMGQDNSNGAPGLYVNSPNPGGEPLQLSNPGTDTGVTIPNQMFGNPGMGW